MTFYVYDQGMRIQTPLRELRITRPVQGVSGLLPVRESEELAAQAWERGDSAIRPRRYQESLQVDVLPRHVRDLMSHPLVSLEPGQSLEEAFITLVDRGCHHLPILLDGRLQGLVSEGDLLRALMSGMAHSAPVAEVMQRQVLACVPDALLPHAATVMAAHRLGALVVVSGELAVGILTRGDLLRAWLTGPALDLEV